MLATCSPTAARAARAPVNPYTIELVEGVVDHQRADRRAARRRTPRAGRSSGCRPSTATSCGSAVFELLCADDVPDAVVDRRGGGAGGELSTDDSPAFVNGLLGPGALGPALPHPGLTPRAEPLPGRVVRWWRPRPRRATDGSARQWLPAPGQSLRSRADRYPVRSNALVLELAYSIGSNPMARKRLWGSNPTGGTHRSRGRQRLDGPGRGPRLTARDRAAIHSGPAVAAVHSHGRLRRPCVPPRTTMRP